MKTVYHVFAELKKMNPADYEKNYGFEFLDEKIKNSILRDIGNSEKGGPPVGISFTTGDFIVPIRISFIQKRAGEILSLYIEDKKILRDVLIAFEEAVSN